MKRKRKHKKEKSKSGSASKAFEKDEERNSSAMEIEDDDTPSSTGTDQPHVSEKPVARVTVKLKTPKVMESQLTSESDTAQKVSSETQGKNEDSDNSLPEAKKSTTSIKIKSSSKASEPVKDQKTPPFQRYDKQELETALLVIKKIMKMDAAEPFNVPVNPVALGIPDYFDVIDTPMDFGTICNNLENGAKYANSEDVYKDVQYIWDNCFKYNNKGDYILDLMKRVKKNFMKYWTSAGLYSEQLVAATTNGAESSQEKIAPTSQIKVYVKGGLSKKSSKKGHGRRHKSDCLCAICVLKRRRREREQNAKTSQGLVGESSAAESPSGDNLTSDMDESTADPNDVKMEESKQGSQGSEEDDEEEEEEEEDEDEDENEEENGVEMKGKDKVEATEQVDANKQEQGIISDPQQPKNNKELEEKGLKIKALETKVRENPMMMELCGTLFPSTASTKSSIWIGRRSLIQKHDRKSKASICTSLRSAIDMLKLKQQPN